jgi:dihydrofolate reductase
MGAVVLDMSMSLDGFVTGPGPRVGEPMGEGGQRLHDWMFSAPPDPGDAPESDETAGVNDAVARELSTMTGAVLMGRRMFEVGIGSWADTPFPGPCFVLTHQPHEDMVMASGTFTFVTSGLATALDRAKLAAVGQNVLVLSPSVGQQVLRKGLLDEIHLHLVPVLLAEGTRLFEHTGQASHELKLTQLTKAPDVTHLHYQLMRNHEACTVEQD